MKVVKRIKVLRFNRRESYDKCNCSKKCPQGFRCNYTLRLSSIKRREKSDAIRRSPEMSRRYFNLG